jgi:hypothetical protein
MADLLLPEWAPPPPPTSKDGPLVWAQWRRGFVLTAVAQLFVTVAAAAAALTGFDLATPGRAAGCIGFACWLLVQGFFAACCRNAEVRRIGQGEPSRGRGIFCGWAASTALSAAFLVPVVVYFFESQGGG